MLSLRGRQGERGGGAGFRGMADDVELEEGEACSDDDGGHGFVDPDVALAYIDEKLQHVLGHFQKDFEGGVSADNLGPKFGGYGSFLPTYQRSPTPLPQTRSSPKVANISTSRSPYQQSAESMRQNPSTVAVESISRNNCTKGTSSGDLCKKERRSSRNRDKDSVSCSDSLDSSSNGTDHKAHKVQIRVGSSNTLVGKNASIYSGLGLDISSSSSMERSPDGLEGLSPEFSNMPYESPRTILQIMTCFSVPGGFLLSPLHGNVLNLTNKVAPLLKKWEKHLNVENLTSRYEGHSEPALHVGHFRSQVSKKMKLDSKRRKTIDAKIRKNVDDTNTIMNKEVKIETSACQEIISDTPSIPCISGGDNDITEVKTMQKEHKINATAPSGFLEKDKYIHSSAAVIDRKNDSRLESNHFENKAKEKTHKDLAENRPVGSQVDKERDMLDNRSAQCDLQRKEMMNDNNEKGFEMSGTARKEILARAQHGKSASEEQELHMPVTSMITTTNAAPVPAPVVINENWVCCDMCQKWRLLPYGTNPSMLPKKWKCSMLNWLPGMNRCDIGEDETTNALNALYVTQAPATGVSSGGPHTAAADTTVSSTHSISGQLEQSMKRKSTMKDGNGLDESSYPAASSFPLMRIQQAPTENKRTVDGEHYPFEIYSVSKHGQGQVSKSANFVVEKQNNKHKSHSSYSDGGDLIEKSKKHLKFQNKRGTDQDEHKTSKKTKKEDLHHFGRDWNHKCDSTARKVPDETETLPAKEKPIKSSCEQGDISLRKEKVSSRYDLLETPKKIDDGDVAFGNKKREHHEDVGRLDLSTKNIAKECDEIQEYSADHASKGAKNEQLKGRKLKRMKSKELTSKVCSSHEKVQDADTMLSSAEGRNNELVVDSKFVTGKEVLSELWENVPPSQALESAEPNRRDAAYLQTSAVATSSSSKISSSRKNKSSQEAKGSPVESVSSSPLRNFNTEKLSHGRLTGKDGSLNVNTSTVHNSGIEVGKLCNGQQAQNLGESQAACEPVLPSSLQGSSASNKKGIAHLAHTQVTDGTHFKRGLDNNLPTASWMKDLAANGSSVDRRDSCLCSGVEKGLDMHSPLPQPDQQNHFYSMTTALDTESDPIAPDSKKSVPSHRGRNGPSHFLPHENKHLEVLFRKEKSQPSVTNQDERIPIVAQGAHSHLKEGKSGVLSTPVKSDASKMKAQLRRSNVETGSQHDTRKQVSYNTSDTASPIRKDNNMVAFALKEARDLKHMANHLKSKGQALESTCLYFEAALKFLHVASLLETPSLDSSRPADAAQSMKMYSETAKLCDFCAHAYERCKEMAAAALAYKCVEVAYLKSAYYKHPSASKDRQELQAVVQIAPGESPSSSASDIDNLNSHGVSKAPSTKGGNSPQVAYSLLPLAVRNQAHLLRLLAYTNDVTCAFDATRKSQIAIAACAGNQEGGKGLGDGLGSVRTVLDLNFNNVDELLRLVRLSMESIGSF